MKTIHKQVKYKDFEVDEELLSTIKALNEAGIETLYSCCGLDEDNDKDKPANKRKGETYITIKFNYCFNSELFIRTLAKLIRDISYIHSSNHLIDFKVDYDINYSYLRCKIFAKENCTFNDFVFIIEKTLKICKII